MSKIICDAYSWIERTPGRRAHPIPISPSFQAALTPWILTLSAEKYRLIWSTTDIKCFSLSPTFQFTRSIGIYFEENEEPQKLIGSGLCAPLFSHLKTLKVSYSQRRRPVCFDQGNEVADFILKFQRLQKFELHLHPESTPPSEFINFYMRLFHSQSITQALLVSVVKSNAINMRKCSGKTMPEYGDLIKQHQIIPFLVQTMVEVYRNDHGESLYTFLRAIKNNFIRSGPRTESDSIDELVPMLDLIEAIVINGDLLHPCFQQQEGSFVPQQRKWLLSDCISRMLFHCLYSANYSRLDFMQRYGRTLLPQLADFVFSKYDGSLPAVRALVSSLDLFFRVIDDYFWTDEVQESETDEEGLKKMLEGGRKLLQHIPFDKLEFAIKEAIKHGPASGMIEFLTMYIFDLEAYCDRVASVDSSELKDAVVRDVAQKLVDHNIFPLCFDCIVCCFKDWLRRGEVESVMNCLSAIRLFMNPVFEHAHLVPPLIRQDFFRRVGIFEKILQFAATVCDDLEEVFGALRCVIQKQKDSGEWSAEDLKTAKSNYNAAKLLFNDEFIKEVKRLLNLGNKMLFEESNEVLDISDDERTETFARMEDAVARIDGLEKSFKDFSYVNTEVMKEIE